MNYGGHVYIMTNYYRTTFYIGVTADLVLRIMEHKLGLCKGFTHKYNCHYLVYHDDFGSIEEAILREKQLKRWHREWKINLIEAFNPGMKDLSCNFIECSGGPETSSG